MMIRNHKSRQYCRRVLQVCITTLMVLPFSIATSPLPPPYYQYSVRGILERPAGGSKSNFAVTLYGKTQIQGDSVFRSLPKAADPENGDSSVGLTDSTGAFFILLNSPLKADSLRLAVIIPDRPTIMGAPFAIDSLRPVTHMETYQNGSKPGCMGCATDPETQQRVSYYSYYIQDRMVTIPF